MVGRATSKFKYEGTLEYTQTAVNVQSLCHLDEQKDILILKSMDASGGQILQQLILKPLDTQMSGRIF